MAETAEIDSKTGRGGLMAEVEHSEPADEAASSSLIQGSAEAEEMEVDDVIVRMGELIDELSTIEDSPVKEKVFELLDWVDAFHREGVVRVAGLLPLEALDSLREDPLIARLFDTYLEEEEQSEDLQAELEEALDEIRPYLHSHGGEMEVLGVAHGVVRLRLMGSCHGCPSSTATLTQGVEAILKERWSGFRKIEVEGLEEEAPEPAKLHQIQSLKAERSS